MLLVQQPLFRKQADHAQHVYVCVCAHVCVHMCVCMGMQEHVHTLSLFIMIYVWFVMISNPLVHGK